MNAEKMFKELGYTKRGFDDFIVYEKGDYISLNVIEFHLKNKIIQSYIEECELGNVISGLTVDELKAINQQCKELGWI